MGCTVIFVLILCICLFQISKDEQFIFCTCGSRVNVLEISTGKIVHSVEHVSLSMHRSFTMIKCPAHIYYYYYCFYCYNYLFIYFILKPPLIRLLLKIMTCKKDHQKKSSLQIYGLFEMYWL